MGQALFVGRFQKSWPQQPVNLDRESDNAPAQIVKLPLSFQILRAFVPSWLTYFAFSIISTNRSNR